MHLSDNEFFEAYKRLERYCSDMYGVQKGVNEYISDMEKEMYRGKRLVPSWENDYRMLKRIRNVRNQLAHDSGEYRISEPEDMKFACDFYNRFFAGKDPLTLLVKAGKADAERLRSQKQQMKQQEQSFQDFRLHFETPADEPKNGTWTGIFLAGAAVAAVIILLFVLLR